MQGNFNGKMDNFKTNFKKLFQDRLFIGIVVLQISMFGVTSKPGSSETLTANQLFAFFSGAKIQEGWRLPPFTAYDKNGRREDVLRPGKPSVVIFRNDCDCEQTQVLRWAEVAAQRREGITIILPVSPAHLGKQKEEGRPAQRILSMRYSEMMRLGLPEKQLPMAIHLDGNSTITAIELGH